MLFVAILLHLQLSGCITNELKLVVPGQSYDEVGFVPFVDPAICRVCVYNAGTKNRSPLAIESHKSPSYDISHTCLSASKFQSASSMRYCLADENEANAIIKKKWASFEPIDRENCVAQSRTFDPSYVETLTCLELDRNSSGSRNSFAKMPSDAATDVTGSIKTPPAASVDGSKQ